MNTIAKLFGMAGEQRDGATAAAQTTQSAAGADEIRDVVQQLAVTAIIPNPYQPRKTFQDEALRELAASIKEYGIVQPLLVRKTPVGYELIAGERRLRAAKLLGVEKVPVIVKDFADRETAELAMIENLQREDLHFMEEAEGYQLLLSEFAMTQEELAARVGKSQSTIANKLRLLKLPAEVRDMIFHEHLSERHARALLKLTTSAAQQQILRQAAAEKLNVRQTEALVDRALHPAKKAVIRPRVVLKDVRIVLNTIKKVVADIRQAGVPVKMQQGQDDGYITITLKIPKGK